MGTRKVTTAPRDVTLVERVLKRHGLDRHLQAVVAGLVPGVRLTAVGGVSGPLRSGQSRLGGEPDLHWTRPWPAAASGYPLHFLAQIRLSDAAILLPAGSLPSKGWLHVWEDSLGVRLPEGRTSFLASELPRPELTLTLDPDEGRPLERRPWPGPVERRWSGLGPVWRPYRERAVRFIASTGVSENVVSTLLDEEETADPRRGYERCVAALGELDGSARVGRGRDHRLLGDTLWPGSEGRLEAARIAAGLSALDRRTKVAEARLRAQAREYRLLLRLDSDERGPGFSWGDAGAAEWWIHDDDLKAGRLERAIGVVEQGG